MIIQTDTCSQSMSERRSFELRSERRSFSRERNKSAAQFHSVILNDLHARFENQSNFLNAFLKDLMIESDKWTNIDS